MTNRQIVTLGIVILCILVVLPFTVAAQGQREGRGGGGGGAPPVNLQILPKDWTRQQVVQVMQGARVMMRMVAQINDTFGNQIGKPASEVVRVQCVTCHRGSAIPKTQ